ncbi:MAG: ATP-grasp domain-containing protein, partial [Oscillospiraceae bacterium]|nr:ATP-grasp domain-containing protein [Oscillospiraceae bacterium]
MENNKPLVIVLSRNYATGLSVIRSLGAAGYDVDLVASAIKEGKSELAACSKYVGNHVEVISKKVSSGKDEGVKKICEELMKYAGVHSQKPVIFPTDDYTASVMDQCRETLEPYFLMPHIVDGGAGSMVENLDKTVQAKLAQEAGLLTPKEWIISLRKEKIRIPEDMVYPCFCKPIESVTGYKREMAKCRSRFELEEHLKKLRKRHADRDVLVQEFLAIDNEIDMSGLCLDQEIIIPAIIKKTNVAQYEKGVTLAGRVVSADELGEVKDKVVEMLKKFRYVGMFDMELNIVGDKIYFNEVNLRSGGPNYSYFKSGVNIPDLFVKAVTGKEFTEEETKVDALGKSFIYEKVAWEDYIHGFMTKEELDRKIAEADINLLYNDDDPAPQKLFIREIKEIQRKQRIKQIKLKVETLLGKIKRKIKGCIKRVVRAGKYRLLGLPQVKKENQRNPQSEKPRVIISGRNYCSNLSLARSFGEAGYEVEILRIFQVKPKRDELMKKLRPDAYSKYIKAYHECITNRDENKIRKRLIRLADPDRKMLLIPADDLVASVVDKNYNRLSEYYLMPNINGQKGAINKMMSKRVQTELARQAGLPVINSCLIKVKKRGEIKIPDTVAYPCFIKPNISKNSSKSRMRRCDSKKELVDTLKQFSKKKDIEMLVEDFINIRKEYSLLGLSTKDGVVIPGFFGAEKGGHGAHRGVALVGRILPVSQQQQLIDDIKAFIGTLGYEGLFDVDLVETEEGKMYYVELNLRYGASGYAVTKCGANLPGMFADYMVFGTPVDPECSVAVTDKTFVSEKIAIDEYISGDLTKEEMMQELAAADIRFVSSEEDPQAYKHFEKFFRIADIAKERAVKAEIKAKEGGLAERTLRKIKSKVKSVLRKIKGRIKRVLHGVKAHLLGLPQTKPQNQRNPQSEKPRVIISGRNYCSNLSLARSFGEAGYEVEVLRIFQTKPKLANLMKIIKPDAYSKYIKAYHVCITDRDESKIKKRLIKMADPDRKMLLIPADDLVASVVDKNYNSLSKRYF